MCQFFSAVVTRDGRILFTEDDSHETIVQRAQLNDGDLYLRHWARVELRPRGGDGWGALHVDETSTPAWLDVVETEARVRTVADRVRPAREAYEAAPRSAWEAYEAVVRSAWEAYEAAQRPAREAYEAVVRSAWEAYEAVVRPAREAYEAALSTIEGYIPPKGVWS